ncbi:unnamed protein product [Protopolystoma xenopodis]|uniref:BPTI/Kunitz inhibitor domain-containing protein n=1 Tax=Protopolystoma xenopodis TaxID=117903 RepID=A0A3S5AJY5_9PLAT|nr:unnamed protein product [Protopolystoma xenopodis]
MQRGRIGAQPLRGQAHIHTHLKHVVTDFHHLSCIDVCRLPKDHGGCTHFELRWYYNWQERRCLTLAYGGCFGNANRFITKEECEGFCQARDICRLQVEVCSGIEF